MTTRSAALVALLALASPAAVQAQGAHGHTGGDQTAPADAFAVEPAGVDTTRLRLADLLAEVAAVNPTLRAARLESAALAEVGDQVGALPDPTASVMVAPYPAVTARGVQRSRWTVEQRLPWPGTLALRREAADLSAVVAAHEAVALDLAFEPLAPGASAHDSHTTP